MPTTLFLSLVSLLSLHAVMAFALAPGPVPRRVSSLCLGKSNQESNSMTRRDTLTSALVSALLVLPTPAVAKCTDIDSCREAGEAKDQQDLLSNPIHRLPNGVEYKVLDHGSPSSSQTVSPNSSVDIAFSVSQANGRYMYRCVKKRSVQWQQSMDGLTEKRYEIFLCFIP